MSGPRWDQTGIVARSMPYLALLDVVEETSDVQVLREGLRMLALHLEHMADEEAGRRYMVSAAEVMREVAELRSGGLV